MKSTFKHVCTALILSFTTSVVWAENIILINPFNVPDGKLDASIQYWEKARNFLSGQPGYVSTKLHASVQPNAEYQLINVAEWETAEAFKTATQKMRSHFKANKIMPPKGLKPNPALYTVIRK